MKTINTSKTGDLSDSKKDQQKMKSETITMDMPEVKDIPGQEHVKVPNIQEMQDVTISSADEEGDGLLDDLNNDDLDTDELNVEGNSVDTDLTSDVSEEEKQLLQKSTGHQQTDESWDVDGISLDEKDNEGELLNEEGVRRSRSGADLDVPGADLDDADENIGEEDEENNVYSQSQEDDNG